MSYYCSRASECGPNREVVHALLEDLNCVIEKSLCCGETLQSGYVDLGTELDRLRGELECCELGRADLERQIRELQNENQRLQFCLEEECQVRCNLEKIITELRGQIERLDECLNAECLEKAQLIAEVRQGEAQLQQYKSQCCDLEAERDGLSKSCRGFDMSKARCCELQEALAQCCEKCDSLQCEVLQLKGENNDLKLKLETCCYEKSKLMGELECLKQQLCDERACLEAQINELQELLKNQERLRVEAFRKMNEIIAAHHDELDNLKTEHDKYKSLFEEQSKAREDLERKLKDCEEQKLKNMQQPDPRTQQKIDNLQKDVGNVKTKVNNVHETVAYQLQIQQQKSQMEMEALQDKIEKYKAMHDEEKKAREELDKLNANQQMSVVQLEKELQQKEKKIEQLRVDVGKYKALHEQEKREREDLAKEHARSQILLLEHQLHQKEEIVQKRVDESEQYRSAVTSAQEELELELQQQQQEFYSHQKLDMLKSKIDRYKTMYDEEKKVRRELEGLHERIFKILNE